MLLKLIKNFRSLIEIMEKPKLKKDKLLELEEKAKKLWE